ncbi:hypothetical protein MTO98_30190 [Mucilaginibacter sp. SMC90]|uniref:hypothetical protein n=1 Tax=Mucilaginibacter sp. SMC90 TaxID=2929803 RepID=UPI001FB43925|nr:hypothetical protein [Mucilaginibacter sp. SMC90]UOE48673.1 hypothetical protein MTO98_30190 [Mucilaginibacter sp. SMC90]
MANIITLAHQKSGGAKSKLALILPLCFQDELKITPINSYLQGDLCNLKKCYLKGKRRALVREVVSQVYYVDILEGLARLFRATLSTGLYKQLRKLKLVINKLLWSKCYGTSCLLVRNGVISDSGISTNPSHNLLSLLTVNAPL